MQNLIWIQEDCSPRNNRADGIVESPQESWNDMEEKLHKLFREHFGIAHIPLERAHWVNRKNKEWTKNNCCKYFRFQKQTKNIRKCQ